MEKFYEPSKEQLEVLEQLTRCQNEMIDNTITDLFIAIGCIIEDEYVSVPESINRLTIMGVLLSKLRKY
ncbi:MAG: hypothetical protein RR304_02690 [Bacteroides sp.]